MSQPHQNAAPASAPGGWAQRLSTSPRWKRLGLALAIAAASDAVSLWIDPLLPLQWGLDLLTAFLLFLILGRRWALLPGLIAEAIPGLGVFPVWVLVVISIILYDDIRKRRT